MKVEKKVEEIAEMIFSDVWQAKALMWIFGVFGIISFWCALFNPWGWVLFSMCGAMFAAGLSEYKQSK